MRSKTQAFYYPRFRIVAMFGLNKVWLDYSFDEWIVCCIHITMIYVVTFASLNPSSLLKRRPLILYWQRPLILYRQRPLSIYWQKLLYFLSWCESTFTSYLSQDTIGASGQTHRAIIIIKYTLKRNHVDTQTPLLPETGDSIRNFFRKKLE